MRQLHDNILYYTKSGAAPGRNAGGGEVAVAIIFSHDCINNIEQGMPLVVSFPSEGTGYEIAGQSLVANAPHPNNAKTWIDWALTGPAQEIGWRSPTAGAYQLPTNPDAEVSDQAVNIAELELVDYDFDAAGEARQRLTEQFENEIATEARPGSSAIAGADDSLEHSGDPVLVGRRHTEEAGHRPASSFASPHDRFHASQGDQGRRLRPRLSSRVP